MPHGKCQMQFIAMVAGALISAPAFAQQEPCIGNSVALTGPAAFGGAAVKYGAEIAIEEINAKGGVLGKKLTLIQYDDAGAPPRGVDNVRRIALSDKCVAIFGGYHSTVGLAQVDPVNEIGIPWIGTTGAGTKIVENGKSPNFMFRVSAKDKWVSKFLADQAVKASKAGKIAVMYENTGWGNGAFAGFQGRNGSTEEGHLRVRRRSTGTTRTCRRRRSASAIPARTPSCFSRLTVKATRSCAASTRSATSRPSSPPGASPAISANSPVPLANGVRVMQTFTWMGEMDPRTKAVWEKIQKKFGLKDPSELRMGSATANSYDAVYILAKAIEKAGSYDWKKVYDALFTVEHDGLVGKYKPAFDKSNPERQDAILPENYKLTAWQDGKLLPIAQTPYGKAQ